MLTDFFLDLFFPSFCVGCRREGNYICQDCELFVSEAALICPACQKSSFTGEVHASCFTLHGLDGLASVWDYDGPVKEIIAAIKYNFITDAANEIVQKAFAAMIRDSERFAPFLAFLTDRSDKSDRTCLTYTPMFVRKEKKRGFNQARLLADAIGRIANPPAGEAGLPVAPLLAKTKDTKSQTELSKEERLQNVRGAFELWKTSFQMTDPQNPCEILGSALSPRRPASRVPCRRGSESSFEKTFSSLPKRVVLVDDVWTTGATMKECCKVLKRAGVQKIWGFTLAKTP